MNKHLKALAATAAAATVVAVPFSASAQEDQSIAEIASGNEDFSTLVAALDAAGLVETFADCEGGPYTVFAPTNAAFEEALSALGLTAEQLLADTETLTSILTYHVVEGAVDAATVVGLDSATTLNGADISIAVDGETVVLNDSINVVTTDIAACNGIIHVIDGVLVPPAAEEAPATTAPAAPSTDLPDTGVDSTTVALVAGGLVLAGAAVVGASRRRVKA